MPVTHAALLRAALAVLLALPAACATTPRPSSPADTPLRVMTFNVRVPTDADGADRWDARRAIAVRMLQRADADLVGTQELFQRQGDEIVAALPQYRWFGRDRRGGHADEHMGVFHRADRLRLLDSGDFWLSDTPGVPGSITWGNLYPRMVTWARFERVGSGRRFTVFNTHLPYRDQDEAARVRGAQLLAARIAALPRDEPVIVTGDFNAAPETGAHAALLAAGLRDAWSVSATRSGPEATFHAFTGQPDKRIDWILVRGFGVRAVRTIDDSEGGRYPSDHFPVVAELTLP